MIHKSRFLSISLLVLPFSVFADTPTAGWQPYYHHMMHGSWIMGGGFMFLFWVLLLLLIVAFVIPFIQQQKSRGREGGDGKSALDILKERYAKGEITKEEFEEKKKDIL